MNDNNYENLLEKNNANALFMEQVKRDAARSDIRLDGDSKNASIFGLNLKKNKKVSKKLKK